MLENKSSFTKDQIQQCDPYWAFVGEDTLKFDVMLETVVDMYIMKPIIAQLDTGSEGRPRRYVDLKDNPVKYPIYYHKPEPPRRLAAADFEP